MSGSPVVLDGWVLTGDDLQPRYRFGRRTLAIDEHLVLYFAAEGGPAEDTDDAGHLIVALEEELLPDGSGALALFSDQPAAGALEDFVA